MAVDAGVSGGVATASAAWSTGISVTHPSSSSGDLLVLFVFRDEDDAGDWNTPSGWTRHTAIDGVETGGRDRVNGIFTKSSSGSEPSSITVTGTVATSRQMAGVIVRYSSSDGLDVTPVASHKSAGTNDATPPNASITTVTDDAMVVCLMGLTASNIDTWAAPSGYTLVDSTLQSNSQIGVAEKVITTAGAESPGDWTNTVNGNIAEYSGATIAIKPAAGGTTINATKDTLTLTEYSTTVNAKTAITGTVDALTLTEYAAQVGLSTDISATVDALTLTEYGASVNARTNITTNVDSLVLTEYPASIGLGINIDAGVDSLTLTEYQATVNAATNIQANKDTLTLTTYQASLGAGTVISATVDSLTLTEYQSSINAATNITTVVDNLTLTEYPASVSLGVVISAGVDALTLTEFQSSIKFDTKISASTDSLTLTTYQATISALVPDYTIDGVTSKTISTAYGALKIYGNGENWFTI